MATKKYRNTKKNKKNHSRKTFSSSSPRIFQTLISQIRSQQGLKLLILKSLYYLLTHFSLNETINWPNCEVALNSFDGGGGGFTVDFSEICSLSDVLFEKLDNRFNQLFYAFRDDISATQADGQADSSSSLLASIDELTLLLRCCMVILTFLVSDLNHFIQKGQVLLLILSRLISTELSFLNEKSAIIFTKLLEVYADELLICKSLREYFVRIDSASSKSKMLFMCHVGNEDLGTVMEVIAAHFILSVSDEQAFEAFHNRLFWQHNNDFKIPEMSLNASLSLLLNPVTLSAPKMFQAYLILLVSETIGINKYSTNMKPDLSIMECYLTAFKTSITLYTRHMSSMHMDGHPVLTDNSAVKSCTLGSSQLGYESYLQPATRNKINHLVTKLSDFWDSYANNRSHRTKSDLVDASIAYVKESLYLFDKPNEDEICSVLTSIIRRGSSNDLCDNVLYKEGRSPQEVYVLASILKLMSSSMLQAIWCLKRSSTSGCLKTLQDVSLFEDYNFLVHLLGSFKQFNIHLAIQKFMSEVMKSQPMRHKESRWMLLHFSGLLSSSFGSGLDFLAKDCILIMMSTLNLFVFEEGDLIALSSLFGFGLENIPSKSCDKVKKASMEQKSSKIVASKFQKIQKLYLRTGASRTRTSKDASVLNYVDSPIDTETEIDKVCNGEIYLKCIEDGSQRSFDFDDLANFIECNQGKDYSTWLKNRERYRKWKSKRKAANGCAKWKKQKCPRIRVV